MLVGFAAETGADGLERARGKLERKGLDLIVLNDVSRSDIGFDSTDNEVVLVTREGAETSPKAGKPEIAARILDRVERSFRRLGRRLPFGRWRRRGCPDEHRDAAVAVRAVVDALASVVHAERGTLELVVVALLAEGHVLIEDVPGVGKTLVARALARAVDCSFSRLQFTPDLLPSDVTGMSVFDQRSASFTFRPGPVFAHLVLVDEINRASPRTQSALLECMQEGQVTVDGETHPLARPFMVIATQNPVEHEGTFPLPEAQLDRFLLRVSLGYPPGAEEARMLAEQTAASGLPLEALAPVCGAAELIEAAAAARAVHVEESLHRYVVSLLHHTRADARLALGASPRAGVALVRASKSLALLRGRGVRDGRRRARGRARGARASPAARAGLPAPRWRAAAIADALAGTPPP